MDRQAYWFALRTPALVERQSWVDPRGSYPASPAEAADLRFSERACLEKSKLEK